LIADAKMEVEGMVWPPERMLETDVMVVVEAEREVLIGTEVVLELLPPVVVLLPDVDWLATPVTPTSVAKKTRVNTPSRCMVNPVVGRRAGGGR
jgi:hypothetical protein